MQKIYPFLWFDDQAEQAANFYTSIFQNAKMGEINYLEDGRENMHQKVLTLSFTLAGLEILALNGGPDFSFTPAHSFFVTCQDEAEINVLWKKLSEGGFVLMEFGQYPFSEKFGWVADKFGLSWQLNLERQPQKIMPCFMFVGQQAGRAEEAMRLYTSLFKDSKISQIDRYAEGEGDIVGNVKHARFRLAGQELIAMDSSLDHQFGFTPAFSFFVECKDQQEVDYFWENLIADGGAPSQCGWLTDKFGVSWQIVPTALSQMLNDPDRERAHRVTQAMLKMTKIEIHELEEAFQEG